MAPHKGKRDEDRHVEDQKVDYPQKQSQQDEDDVEGNSGDDDDDGDQHQHSANPPDHSTIPAPDAPRSTPALPPLATSLPLNTPIPSSSFETVTTSAQTQSTSNLAAGTVFTPTSRPTTTASTAQQASNSSTSTSVVSATRTEITSISSVSLATSSIILIQGSAPAEISTGTVSVLGTTTLPSANATPFDETAAEKSTNAPAVIAGSILGVLALVLFLLFIVYRKRAILACFGKRRGKSGRPPTHADPEMTMNGPSIRFDARNPGPLERNPPNVADIFALDVKAPALVRQRPKTPENLSTVLEEIRSQHSRPQRDSQDSYPTPHVAQAIHIQPAATTNADDIPLLSSNLSPFVLQQPGSTARKEPRNSLSSQGDLIKPPAARKSINGNRDSVETVQSAPRFRTVESWVNSQAKRLNLPSVRRDSRQSERASSVSSEAMPSFSNPPVPPKV